MIELEMRHDGGLAHDLPLVHRRRMTGLVRGTTVAALAGMTLGKPELATALATRLSRSGIVRDDIRRSFGTSNGVARGVPLTVRLRLLSANSGQPITAQAVYLWQADRDGAYSLYSPGLSGENYLRGVQATDRNGWVQFRSIFPGANPDRRPHLNVEIYPSLETATEPTARLHGSRLTLPSDACATVYARPDYASSRPALSADMAADAQDLAMMSVTGDVSRGFTAVRTITI